MMRNINALRWTSTLLAALFPFAVGAAPSPLSHALIPTNPTSADEVQLQTRVDGCSPPAVVDIDLDTGLHRIDIEYRIPDVVCDPTNPSHVQSPRLTQVGKLPAGNYAVRIVECQISSGLDLRFGAVEGTITVSPQFVRHAIPALSWAMTGLLIAAICMISARRR